MTALADLRERTLENGLRIIVREDPTTPVVALNFWVRVGSNNETGDLMGWSHGIEHMLFKGTARRPSGAIAREITNAGGETNAGTGYETTNYYIVVPRDEWRTALDIHADVLMNSTFDPAELDNERQVLIEENAMYRDRPAGFGITWEELFRLGFSTHRYRHPIGGPDANLAETPRERILEHLKRYYRPNNIVYVVVGDVRAEEVFAAAEAAFAGFAPLPLAIDESPAEPPQAEFRFREMSGDVNRVYGKIGFHIPAELDARNDALQVMTQILGSGRTSRFYRNVREPGHVSAISVTAINGFDPGYLVIDFQTEVERVLDALTAIFAELGRLRRETVTEAELERTKRSVRSHFTFGLETAEGQASVLGHYATLGDVGRAATLPERIAAVTGDSVRAVAERHLGLDQATVLLYGPRERTLVADPARLLARLGAVTTGVTGGVPDPAVPGSGAGPERSRFAVTKTQLANGLTVLVEPQRALPIVAIALYVRGGSALEPDAAVGLTQLMQSMRLKGAGGRSAERLAEILEGAGAHARPFAGRDLTGLSLSATREELAEVLPIFVDLVRRPDFPADRFAREQEKALSDLAALRDNTLQWTMKTFSETLYGGHPYGRPVLGREDTIPGLSAGQLAAWHESLYRPERMVMALVGDLDVDEGMALAEAHFGNLVASARDLPVSVPAFDTRGTARRIEVHRDKNQAVVVLGCPGPSFSSPDRYALDMLMAILSGMGNRLFVELRDRRHLCYFTGAFGSLLQSGGSVGAYVGTRPENEEEAVAALKGELRRAATDLPTAEEMQRARNTIAGGYLIDLQRRAARASVLAQDEASGLGFEEALRYTDRIAAVTPEEVRAVADRWFDLDNATLAVLRPGAAPPAPVGHA